MELDYKIILGAIFFVVLISVQYTLNKILLELKEIKKYLSQLRYKDEE